jgi:AraC-like DNA-binding protein
MLSEILEDGMQTIEISRNTAARASRHNAHPISATDRKQVRVRRRFRLNYPDEVVECAVLLSCLLGVRKAAVALDLRLSTVYRWFNKHRSRRSQFVVKMVDGQNVQAADAPHSMIVRCADRSVTSHPYVLSQLRGTSEQARSHAVEALDGNQSSRAISTQRLPPHERISATKKLIDDQYGFDWSCEKLAKEAGISKFQFINEFSAAFGESPYHYLLGVRVHHAVGLVKQSDRTLADIALSVGFRSSSSMQRAFKNFMGASPANFVNGAAPFAPSSDVSKERDESDRNWTAGAQARRFKETKTINEHHAAGI